jgi:murein DD-endopeptidase MepM/ murein hydrolase activator NlpD
MFLRKLLLFRADMQRGYFYFLTALVIGLGLSGCDTYNGPVRVINLGLHPDSATGAIMVGAHDNLWDISRRYRLPVREIIDINGLEPPYKLSEGRRLKLPAPVDYRVRHGDTLHAVAGMFGVSASQLVAVNNIRAPYRIRPGQALRIPETYRVFAAAEKQDFQRQDAKTPRVVSSVTPSSLASPRLGVSKNSSGFIWPVRGKIISGYGPKDDGLYNDGINIAAPRGTPVAAAADGIVAYVGNDLKSYGNLVLIRHGGGTMTAYAHLSSITARRGMRIGRGQVIGTVGATGAVPVSQLHFEIRHGSKTCDPKQYLG